MLETPLFSILNQHVRGPDRAIHNYYTISFVSPAVGVIARQGDKYLLIHQYRFIVDEYVWAIPSGGVEKGESLVTAAERELMEETGWRARQITHLFGYYPSYGATDQRFELFLAEDLENLNDSFDPCEVLKIGWFDRKELIDMVLSNRIVDGLSLTPLAVLLLREELERSS
jgi:8-oxo-dGTP pyrophosphatase MutT (NUDIX family)